MPKSSLLIIHEDVSELRSLIRKESNPKNVLRLQSLVHIKEETFATRVLLANHLGYHVRSMELWLKSYDEGGIEAMLLPNKRKPKKRLISKEVELGLSERLNNPEQGFYSYVHAHDWVKETYGIEYKYHTLRNFMIDVFGSKIKQPRKSHVKKDLEAGTAFLKAYPNSSTL